MLVDAGNDVDAIARVCSASLAVGITRPVLVDACHTAPGWFARLRSCERVSRISLM